MTKTTLPPVFPGASLAIVDMHEQYLSPLPDWLVADLVPAVLTQVERSIALGHDVIDVQYGEKQKTMKCVTDLFSRCKRSILAIKEESDGSAAISAKITEHQLGCQIIRIVGVYACACVYWTVIGLAKLYPHSRIEVVPAACGFRESDYEIFQMPEIPSNVKVIFSEKDEVEEVA